MAKFLLQASYTNQGIKGLMKDGGRRRKEAVEQLITDLGGTLETFYFCFGEDDAILIVDAPDNVTIAAASLAVAASGAADLRTTVLITPEEMDQAAWTTVSYTPPGG